MILKFLMHQWRVEIWAHVYVQKFVEACKSWFSFRLINIIAQKIIYHCKEIDIGERRL